MRAFSRLYSLVIDNRTGSGWRLPALDGLRGVAALMVLAAHTLDATFGSKGTEEPLWLAPILRGGAGGVVLFFALSGFLLYLPWLRAHLEHRAPPRFKIYAIRRCMRIMPAYYGSVIALAVLRVVIGGREPLGAAAMALHVVFLPTLIAPLVSVYWTLQVEEFFYWVLPLCHRAMIRLGPERTMLGAVVVCVGWSIAGVHLFSGEAVGRWLQQTPFFLPAFTLGIITAWQWGKQQKSLSASTMVIAGTVAYLAISPLSHHLAVTAPLEASLLVELAMAPAASAVVLGAARGGAPVLEHPALRFIGGISFSLYLWHLPIIKIVPLPTVVANNFVLRLFVTSAMSIVVALASYLVVERPFLQLRPRERPTGS